jgi:hypothetical protein
MSYTFTDTQGRVLANLGACTRACPACDYQATMWPWRVVRNGGAVLASNARWARVCPKCHAVCETTERHAAMRAADPAFDKQMEEAK